MNSIFFLIPLFLLASPHQVKANPEPWIGGFNCFGDSECNTGWNAGVQAAVTDWHSGIYNKDSLNSGDYNYWGSYSNAKCHAFLHGYIYEWTQLWLKEHKMTKTPDNGTAAINDYNDTARSTIHQQKV